MRLTTFPSITISRSIGGALYDVTAPECGRVARISLDSCGWTIAGDGEFESVFPVAGRKAYRTHTGALTALMKEVLA